MRSAVATLAVALALSIGGPATAHEPPAIGISDQQWTTLTEPLVRWLGIRHARLIAPWDVALHPSRPYADWLAWAQWAGIEPLVSFTHRPGEDCRRAPCHLPSTGEYRQAYQAFRARWPHVRAFSPWNEANHPGQPTAEHPGVAAAYHRVALAHCPGCTVLSAEVVDIPGMLGWLRAFQAAAGTRAGLWGLHNYGDVTRRQDGATTALLEAVDGEVWVTETGGLVRFEMLGGEVRWPEDEARAKASLEYAFGLADRHPARIRRLYVYNWREAPGQRWDSGLLSPAGRLRPSFWALAARMRPRAAGRGRVLRRPRLDRRMRVGARIACAASSRARCRVVMAVRAPRRKRVREVARVERSIRPGGRRLLRVRLARREAKRIRRGRLRRLRVQLWLGADHPARYRVRCRPRR